MKKLYILLLVLLPMLCEAQQTIPPTGTGNATSISLFNGQVYSKKGIRLSSDTAGMRALWALFLPLKVDTGCMALVNGNFLYYTGAAWVTPSGGGGGSVSSVFGRAGAVTAQAGDYTTSLVSEGTNLYFTNVRADARIAAALVDYYTSGQIDAILDDYLTTADAATTYVPLARILTINGTAYDLSANRSWTVTGTTAIYNKWGNIIFGMDSVATDTSLVTSRARAKKIGDSVAALIPTNNNQLTNGAGYITGYTETDPLSYHFGDTNGYKQPVTRSYGILNYYPLSGNPSGFLTSFTETDPLSYHYADTNTYKKPASYNYVKDNYYLASNPNSWIGLGAISALAPLVWNSTTGQMSITQASGSTNGYLSSTDWTTFNNKQASGTYISYILSGFAITATGTTSVTVGVDTALVATRLRVQKAVDSLSAVVAAAILAERSATATLTNKRITYRVGSTTSSATPTINTDNVDIYKLTAQTVDITSFTTNLSGTPNDGDILEIQITGTAARAITWGSSFVSSTFTLPTTTVTTATLTVMLQYNTTSSYGNNKWVCAGSW